MERNREDWTGHVDKPVWKKRGEAKEKEVESQVASMFLQFSSKQIDLVSSKVLNKATTDEERHGKSATRSCGGKL